MARAKKIEAIEDAGNKAKDITSEETKENAEASAKESSTEKDRGKSDASSKESSTENASNKDIGRRFSKEQILELEEYRDIRDVVSAVLFDKEYDLETAYKLIKSYLESEVG